jgi:hypothetical protein
MHKRVESNSQKREIRLENHSDGGTKSSVLTSNSLEFERRHDVISPKLPQSLVTDWNEISSY